MEWRSLSERSGSGKKIWRCPRLARKSRRIDLGYLSIEGNGLPRRVISFAGEQASFCFLYVLPPSATLRHPTNILCSSSRREQGSIQQGKCCFYRSLISRFWDSFLSSKWCNFKNKGWINPDIFIFKIVKLLYSLWLLLLLLFLSIEIIVKGEFEYSSLHF